MDQAVLGFSPGHPVVGHMLSRIPESYNPMHWADIGPTLWTRVLEEWNQDEICKLSANEACGSKCLVNVYSAEAFYPNHFTTSAEATSARLYDHKRHQQLLSTSFTLHLWGAMFKDEVREHFELGSLAFRLMHVQDDYLVRNEI